MTLMGDAILSESIMGDQVSPDSESYSGVVMIVLGVTDRLTLPLSVHDDLTLSLEVRGVE